jgi:hypothetical protein
MTGSRSFGRTSTLRVKRCGATRSATPGRARSHPLASAGGCHWDLAVVSPWVPCCRSGWRLWSHLGVRFLQPLPRPLGRQQSTPPDQPDRSPAAPQSSRPWWPRLASPSVTAPGSAQAADWDIRSKGIGDAVKQLSAWHSARPPWCRSFPYKCCRHRQRRRPRPIAGFLRPELLRTARE